MFSNSYLDRTHDSYQIPLYCTISFWAYIYIYIYITVYKS